MSNLYEQTSGISNQIIEAVCNELLSMQPGSKRNSGDIANELSNRFNVDKIFIQSIIRLTISISPEHTCKQGRYGGIRRAGGLDNQIQESSDALSDDGPAVEWANGNKCWYKNGKYHRKNGPAIECANGDKEYWYNGKRLNDIKSDEDLKRYIKLLSIS